MIVTARRGPRILFAVLLVLGIVFLASRPARAVEEAGYTMEILVDGRPLAEYPAREARYVEALRNRAYSVRLRNRTPGRVAIALAVDGLNSIDARTTTAAAARKWVLEPYETITLDGWQVSSDTARRFFFTTEEKSYGAWLGRRDNLGVIAAAVFREKTYPTVVPLIQDPGGAGREKPTWDEAPPREDAKGERSGSVPGASAAPGAPSAVRPAKPGDLAATGIGEETSHPVRHVTFVAEDTPAAVLEIRYEYREGLARLGILPERGCDDALARRERARGFTDEGYAPDPYRRPDR